MRAPKNETGGNFIIPDPDTYPARVYRVIDQGSQANRKGDVKRKLMVSYELVGTRMSDEEDRPLTCHSTYNFSMFYRGPKECSALARDVAAMRGKPFAGQEEADAFDLDDLIDLPCLLQVVHNESGGKTYANVGTVTRPPKGMEVGPCVNAPVALWLEKGLFDEQVFSSLSENMQKKIAGSPEYLALHDDGVPGQVPAGGYTVGPEMDGSDEIPFA